MNRPHVLKGTPRLQIQVERTSLSQALLTATAGLVRQHDADTVLQQTCESLVRASPHITSAWISLQTAGERMRPTHAAGVLREPLLQAAGPDEVAAVLAAAFDAEAEAVCFAFSDSEGERQGAMGVLAARSDYFQRIGPEPFLAFADVCGGVLEQARLREKLKELAEFDNLTGLFNRAAMLPILEHEHANARRTGKPYALMLVDVDQFKTVNDGYGHAVGDRVLAAVAHRAGQALRHGDWLSRWGGEEFLALLPSADVDEAMAIAERLRERIAAAPVRQAGVKLNITISAGVACYPRDGSSPKTLLNAADAALYAAKQAGRNQVCRANREGQRVFAVARQVEKALRTEQIAAAYQPIIELSTGRVVAEEALARMRRDGSESLRASEFIEAATQRQLVHRIDYEIFHQAIRRCHARVAEGHKQLLFINVSADLLRRPELIEELADQVRREARDCEGFGLAEPPLVLEITERDFLDPREARTMLTPLLELGLGLAIDDFGSGYSSFQYLAELPVRFLKIEGRLVGQAREARVEAILRGMKDIAAELGLITLAEGVEDAETLERLRAIGVDWAQGYYFGEPRSERW